jgi:hypothetical protein
MTGPAEAARQLLSAVLLGGLTGLGYGFLRPAKPRYLMDLFFVLGLGWVWIYLCFGVCRGDPRLGHTLALLLGAFAFHRLFGRWLLPVFSLFWQGIYGVFVRIFACFKKFFKKLHFSSFHRRENRVE